MEIGCEGNAPPSGASGEAGFHIGAFVLKRVGGEDANHAAHGAASVECSLRTAQDIDAIDVGETEIVARLVRVGDVIDIHSNGRRVDAGADAADIDRRGQPTAIVRHEKVRRKTRQVFGSIHAPQFQGTCVKERDADGLAAKRAGFLGRGDHHSLFDVKTGGVCRH